MTKNVVFNFLKKSGYSPSYSGKEKAIYVSPTQDTEHNINVKLVQHFGITPDFQIKISKA